MVVDIYDPFHLEQLEQARDLGAVARQHVVRAATEVLNQQLVRGDFFMCASEKQRDFWLGQLAAVGRVNPLTYDDDESLRCLVTIVPFGVSDMPPRRTRPALKGVVPGIGTDDKVILWGGGIYNWFDPLTLLRAVDKLRRRLPEVRLFFLGLKHPNPHVPEMRMAVDARALSDELGLTGTVAFFNEDWVEYDDRQNYLLDADVGVSTHLDHVETQFSFRTRILDYFWASLPVVATGGDALAEIVESTGAGLTVPPEDLDALEDALYTMLTDGALRARARGGTQQIVDEFRWSRVLAPLVEFCREPARAPDIAAGPSASALDWRLVPRRSLRRDVGLFVAHLRDGRWRTLAAKIVGRVRLRLGQRRS
jgi:glycosyltransferase involved in cell wall biosynthesis